MPDIVKKYLDKIKDIWNKYDRKQKTIFVSSVSVIIIALVILVAVLAKPQYIVVKYCSSAAEATEVRELLTSNNINCTVSSGDWAIRIDAKDEVEAQLVLGSNNISANGFTIQDAMNGGFTQTESDKDRLYQKYLESKFEKILTKIDGIKAAEVSIWFTDTGSTIFTENKDANITAVLTTTKTLDSSTVEGIGLLLANNVGSNNANNVVIFDASNGALLYSGATDGTTETATASTAFKFKKQLEDNLKAEIRDTIIATQLYSDVRVIPNLVLDNDKVTEIVKEYEAPAGTDQGLYEHSYEVDSSGKASNGGVAGTESNDDDTDYLLENGVGTDNEYSLRQYDWLQNSKYTTTEKAAGTVKYDESRVSLMLIKYNIVTEEELQTQGLLEDVTYEEYKIANKNPIRIPVEDDLTEFISNATGIGQNRISLMGVQINTFIDSEKNAAPTSLIVQIVLAAIIVALLLFVVLRSARPVTIEETEPELSVEDMLASTREQQTPLDEIDLQDKSEARKAIEKFVQENPEAVALLLRNWLSEGWD